MNYKPTTGMDPDEGTPEWYRRMFTACVCVPGKEQMLFSTLKLIEKGMPRYRNTIKSLMSGLSVSDIEFFAYILGTLHYKEASCNFNGVLHNGERIIGTGKKTKLVPPGRGPFVSWEHAAVDALKIKTALFRKLILGSKDIGDVLYCVERYNGIGHIKGKGKAETSPYLWSCSNINDGYGKFVADGRFDPNAYTGHTVGAALILKELYSRGLFKCTGLKQKEIILKEEMNEEVITDL